MKAYNNNTTVYFFDGINTILEKYKASNWANFSTSAVYTLAPGVVGHIVSMRKCISGPTTDLYYHYDPIGNVQFITDSYGNITVSYVQEGFGNVLATNGSLTSNNYHLTTKESDPDSDLYYFYARWYDPVTGRFITKDSERDINLYIYAINNPLLFTDPSGLTACRSFVPPMPKIPQLCVAAVLNVLHNSKGKDAYYRHCVVGGAISRYCGASWCIGAGPMKEFLDKYLHIGTPDWQDIVATLAGCACGQSASTLDCCCKNLGYNP